MFVCVFTDRAIVIMYYLKSSLHDCGGLTAVKSGSNEGIPKISWQYSNFANLIKYIHWLSLIYKKMFKTSGIFEYNPLTYVYLLH